MVNGMIIADSELVVHHAQCHPLRLLLYALNSTIEDGSVKVLAIADELLIVLLLL